MITNGLSLRDGRLIAAIAGSLLLAVAPGPATAGKAQGDVTTSRVSNLSLTDLDLSTPNGMQEAQRRLRVMAEQVCRESASSPQFESQAAFVSCVKETVASQIRQITVLTNNLVSPRSSVTRSAGISLDDLDLSTNRGYGIAKQRLEATVRRLCDELAQRRDLTPGQNRETCIQEGLTGALAQVRAIIAAKESRLAARVAP
jgi:UrcA family protein